jgi:rhodanese-related sulfurtransferase
MESENNLESVKQAAQDAAESVKETAQNAAGSVKETVSKVAAPVIPSQPPIRSESDVHELKSRLEWGEPALTILDVRDRPTFNEGRVLGALSTPIDRVVEIAESSLAKSRDIYVYGDSDAQSAEAAQLLRSAGFEHVSVLKGGLAAWKAIGGPTEGIVESQARPGADEYNVVSRLQAHAENQKK